MDFAHENSNGTALPKLVKQINKLSHIRWSQNSKLWPAALPIVAHKDNHLNNYYGMQASAIIIHSLGMILNNIRHLVSIIAAMWSLKAVTVFLIKQLPSFEQYIIVESDILFRKKDPC